MGFHGGFPDFHGENHGENHKSLIANEYYVLLCKKVRVFELENDHFKIYQICKYLQAACFSARSTKARHFAWHGWIHGFQYDLMI
jgi:hypothetical protein